MYHIQVVVTFNQDQQNKDSTSVTCKIRFEWLIRKETNCKD